MKNVKKAYKQIIYFWIIFFFSFVCFAQEKAPSAVDRAVARDNFRLGVQAFYRGAFNDSILVFEKALSSMPNESLILDWLGKAYYYSGLEGTALQQWDVAENAGYGGLLLKNKIDIVRNRRTLNLELQENHRFVEAGNFPSMADSIIYYLQPISAYPLNDGSFWVVAYGSNEIIHYNANGVILERSRGPLTGFLRPFDISQLKNGDLIISEYAADRISILSENGRFKTSFGSKGRGDGQFIGPQYLSVNSRGYIYVTDFGNSRIVVFDSEGKYIFSFGTKTENFPGLVSPSGICCTDDFIYVADGSIGALYCFDLNGNFLSESLPPKTFVRAEGVKCWNDKLLISDTNRVYLFDPLTEKLTVAADVGKAPVRLTSAVPDVNGNLITTDYKGNQILLLSGMSDLVGGLFVQIERINADNFPRVSVDIRVEDRNRNPVVGLTADNFFLSEEKRPVSEVSFDGAGYTLKYADIAILVDRSLQAKKYEDTIKDAISEIATAMEGQGTLKIISAGEVPVLEYSGNPKGATNFQRKTFRAKVSNNWNFDLGLRLAGNELINATKKRAVIFLSVGDLSAASFKRYGLADLAAFLNNNGILFETICLEQGKTKDEISYLCKQTGGVERYVFLPEGLSPLVRQIIDTPNGSYTLSFTSTLPTDFGQRFLPVELEVYLMNRSGRDETGYFKALQ